MDRILLLAAALYGAARCQPSASAHSFSGLFPLWVSAILRAFYPCCPLSIGNSGIITMPSTEKKAFFSCPSGGNPCHLPYGGDRFSATGNVLHDSGQGGVHYEPLYRHRAVFCLLCGAAPSSDCYHREPPCHDRYVFSCVSYGWSFF